MYAQVRLGAARRLEAQWGMQEDGGASLDEQVHLLHLLHLRLKASHASS